jgi:type IV secretory pathway VirB9-like protein
MRTIIPALLFTAVALVAAPVVTKPPEPILEAKPSSRLVHVEDKDIVEVTARLRYTTMIILPKEENILDFACGDKENWTVNGGQNIALVKPSIVGAKTNLHLITASGNTYSFALTESSTATPDQKIFVEAKGQGLLASLKANPRFVASTEVENYRAQVEIARGEAKRAQEDAARQIAESQKENERKLATEKAALAQNFGKSRYRWKDGPPFNVTSIYNDPDMKFTFIRASTSEPPALYEEKDGKPSLIEYQFANGVYRAPKIIDAGYLKIGKKELHFIREIK